MELTTPPRLAFTVHENLFELEQVARFSA
jgi:hypothetical protein